jgi:hypothetical protein
MFSFICVCACRASSIVNTGDTEDKDRYTELHMKAESSRQDVALAALFDGSETLEKPLVSDELAIPKRLELIGDSLQFSAAVSKHVPSNSAGLLTDFVALAHDDNGRAIVRYAKRFGPLGLCRKHSLPALHADQPCWPKRASEGIFTERLASWQHHARRVRAILSIAAAFRRSEPGAADDWRTLFRELARAIPDSDEGRAWFLALAVNGLLDNAQPKLMIYPSGRNRLQIAFAGVSMLAGVQLLNHSDPTATKVETHWLSSAGNLLAAISLQTAMVVASHGGLAKCSDCGDLYRPTRALSVNQLHFCLQCGQRASRKLWNRRSRNPEEKKKYEQTIRRKNEGNRLF